MQTPIVREYRDDILHTNPENQIRGEPFTTETPGVWTRIIVPRHSPFFIKSLKLYFKNGQEMTEEHFEIYRIMPGLTSLAAQGVACLIRLKDPTIVEGFMDYDVVGEFTLFDTSMMSLVITATEDDRMIDWVNLKNKPIVFPPTWHPHSLLFDYMAFQDTIDLLNSITKYSDQLGTPLIEIKISKYFANFNHYLALYKAELLKFLTDHAKTYNSHGINALQVALEKVDNFATAVEPGDLLGGRDDMHLTVQGLATIVNQTGFDSGEYLIKDSLPISQYGNANFIPPDIDGSFEALGGVYEAAGICQESDGNVLYLHNRMDGRVRGLYFSTLKGALPGSGPLDYSFSNFRYTHPRFVVDGATVDRIAQGSGDEVILVGDSANNLYYIGMTNGSLDPAKHVYSRIDLSPLLAAIYTNPNRAVNPMFRNINIARMGSWIYLFLGASVPSPVAEPSQTISLRFKHIFRVNVADVQATIPVTPVRQNVSFTDADGVGWGPTSYWRWFDEVKDGDGNLLRALFNFQQPLNPFAYIGISSVMTMAAEDPNRPGIYALKFFGGYYASYFGSSFNGEFNYAPEITYEFNPATGVMTRTSLSNVPSINFGAVPVIPAGYTQNPAMIDMVRHFEGQGMAILPDGKIYGSSAAGAFGYPRMALRLTPPNSLSRYNTTARLWGTAQGWPYTGELREKVVQPLTSGGYVRCMLYKPGAEFYIASQPENVNFLQLYYRAVSGGYALRPGVSNLYVGNMYSRPLVSTVRKVNAPFGLGGMTVTVPGSQVANYGVEIGHSAFCMGVQKKYFNREMQGNAWPGGVGADDVIMMANNTERLEADGTITLVPGVEIMYPAWIVEVLKAQVQNPAIKDRGRACFVTICDPTFSSGAFGWLPITVGVTYLDTYGLPNTDTVYTTFMTINASYSAQGNRQVVTGVSVIDILHFEKPSSAYQGSIPVIYGSDPANEGAQTSLGSMRTYYYLNPQSGGLDVYFCAGVRTKSVFDFSMINCRFSYANRDTRRWTSAAAEDDGSLLGAQTVTPDNGIARSYAWKDVSGGAATIINGPAYKALLGSIYPAVGWGVFFKTPTIAVFNGQQYTYPAGMIDLRDVDPSPGNKTFYIYAVLRFGVPVYDVTQEKRLESAFQIWVARVTTNSTQVLQIERFNVFTLNGSRISEIKRGNSIPASSGLVNVEGQLPWLRSDEMLS